MIFFCPPLFFFSDGLGVIRGLHWSVWFFGQATSLFLNSEIVVPTTPPMCRLVGL